MIRIGTRGSPLALAQAHEIKQTLLHHHGLDESHVPIVTIQTTGDRIVDRPLGAIGGKGLFTKEIEVALLSADIDIAVHSAKDMATVLPQGLTIGCIPAREDPRDVLVCPHAGSLAALAPGARLGTASLRRQAMVRRQRPDIDVGLLRGNVGTRLKRIAQGQFDATILAAAGLKRLQMAHVVTAYLPLRTFVPAVAQGALILEVRTKDTRIQALLEPLNDPHAAATVHAERAFLTRLDGSCRTPIAAHARISDTRLHLHGMLLSPDGQTIYEDRAVGDAADAHEIGQSLGEIIRHRAGETFMAMIQETKV